MRLKLYTLIKPFRTVWRTNNLELESDICVCTLQSVLTGKTGRFLIKPFRTAVPFWGQMTWK